MLALKISDKYVDLPNDFSFTMNLKSPVFGEVGSYSYPFRIPATARNAVILDFLHRVENTTDVYKDRSSMFEWNGLALFTGTSRLKSMNNKSYEGSVFDGSGDFNYQFKNNYLQQYDFGEQVFATEAEAMTWINGCRDKVYPERACAFPEMYNDLYFEAGHTEGDMLAFNFYNRITNNIGKTSYVNGYRTPIVPMLYFRYVLEKLFAGMGYILDDSFFTANPAFNKLVMYNSVTCNNETEGFFPYWITHLYYNYHVPRIKLSDFFTGIENFFNVRFFVNQVAKTIRIVPLSTVLASSNYLDYSKGVINVLTEIEDKINGFKLKMELDGDDTAFTDQNAYEDQFLQSFKGSVDTVALLPPWPIADPLEIRYVIATGEYYKMLNKSWVLLDSATFNLFTHYLYGDFSTDLTTKFSTLIMGGDSGFCNVKNKQINFTDITPRIFYAKYGTYGDQSYVVGYNTNLFYNDGYGLFNLYFKDWLSWRMSAKLVKITRQMTFQELKDFSFDNKIMVNGTKFLVRNIQVTIKKDRILPAMLECYVCP